MRFDRWKDVIELTGIVAIVASLIFVGLQIRQDDRTARLELFDRAEEQLRGFRGFISEHADVWHRGCSGAKLSGEDKVIFVAIYNTYIDHNFLRWMRYAISDVIGTDPPLRLFHGGSRGRSSSRVDSCRSRKTSPGRR